MSLAGEEILKIVLAILAGGLVGLEREFRDKAAGFRTLVFICVGATSAATTLLILTCSCVTTVREPFPRRSC